MSAGDRAAYEKRLREILAAQGLAKVADDLAREIRCAIRVVRTPLAADFLPAPWPTGKGKERRKAQQRYSDGLEAANAWMRANTIPLADLPLGASRLGGQPDLPADFDWPRYEGRPLGFLGQFDLGELGGKGCAAALPAAGQLAFFYEWTEEPWGFDPKHKGSARVMFVPPGATLVRHRSPEGLEDFDHPSLATFEDLFTHPLVDAQTTDWRRYGVDPGKIDWYEVDEALGALRPSRPQHHLLGHPRRVQNPMEVECQLVSNGYYCGDETGYEKAQRNQDVMAGIADWMLLYQCDSDDTGYDGEDGGIGHMWGDCGLIYFWIRRQDLSARDFSRTWTILQCS